MATNLIQFVKRAPGTSSAPSVTIASTAAGSLIVVAISGRNGSGAPTVSSVTDSAGNTYSQVSGARSAAPSNGFTDFWYFPNAGSGVTSVTATLSGSAGDAAMGVWEVGGAATSSPVDVAGNTGSHAGTAGPTLNTTGGDEFLAAVLVTSDVLITAMADGSPWTSDAIDTSGLILIQGYAHYIAAASGSYQPAWKPNSGNSGVSAVAFKAAGGGGGTPVGADALHYYREHVMRGAA